MSKIILADRNLYIKSFVKLGDVRFSRVALTTVLGARKRSCAHRPPKIHTRFDLYSFATLPLNIRFSLVVVIDHACCQYWVFQVTVIFIYLELHQVLNIWQNWDRKLPWVAPIMRSDQSSDRLSVLCFTREWCPNLRFHKMPSLCISYSIPCGHGETL